MKCFLTMLILHSLIAEFPAQAQQTMPQAEHDFGDQALSIDPQAVTGTLDNGFRYVLRHNENPPNEAELRLLVNAGSVLEDADQRGLAHFVSHMAFRGTRNFEGYELSAFGDLIGMTFGPDINASASFDETIYMLRIPTDTLQVVETAFQILEDWAHQVSFEAAEIEKERQVVVEECRLGQGARQRMRDAQVPILLKDSRYVERLPLGVKAVLDTFRHESLRRFYETWYRPDLMSLLAVGDFEPSHFESLIRLHFSRLTVTEQRRERVLFKVPDHEETLIAIASDVEAKSNFLGIYTKQEWLDRSTLAAYRESLLEALYHNMMNQRFSKLTRHPDPPFLGARGKRGRLLRTKEFDILSASVKNNGFRVGLAALLTEAERVRQHGFTRAELRRSKLSLMRGMEQVFRERANLPSRRFVTEYVRHLLDGEAIPGIEKEHALYGELLPGIALAEVDSLAIARNNGSNRVIVVAAPKGDGFSVPTEEELRDVFAWLEEREIEPYPEDVSDAPLVKELPLPGRVTLRESIPEIGVTTWKLNNGVRVVLKPTRFQNDQILFSAYSPGGHSLALEEDYMAAATAAAVVAQSGIGELDQIALGKKLVGKMVKVSPYITERSEGMTGLAAPDDLKTLFELVHGYFTAPRLDSTAFASYRKSLIAKMQNRRTSPENVYADTINVIMTGNHHRARPWSLDLFKELDLAKAAVFYRDRFADAGDFTLIFVGNFSLAQIEPLVCAYVATLPSSGRQESWRDVGMAAPVGVVDKFVRIGSKPTSQSTLIFKGPFEYDGWSNNFRLDVLSSVLEIKLRQMLRAELSRGYEIWVSSNAAQFPREEYTINIGFECAPNRVEELTRVVFEQIDSLKTVGTSQIYVDKIREIRKRQRQGSLNDNGFWRSRLEWCDTQGVDPRMLLRYSEMVDGLTTDAVRKAAQQYFNMKRYARFVLHPEDYAYKSPSESQ